MENTRIHGSSLKEIWKRSLTPREQRKYPYDGQKITLESMGDENLKDFLASLTQNTVIHELRSIPELSLYFSRCHGVTFIGQETLFQSIQQHFQDLTSLTLQFWAGQGTTDKSLEVIGEGVRRSLPNLKRLELIFIECPNITDKGVDVLGQELSQNLDLDTLEIKFQHCRGLTGESLTKLGSHISRNLFKLQSLALSFVLIENLSDEHIEELMLSFDGKLVNLRHLNLSFCIDQLVTDEGFGILGKKIAENFQALENLELVISGPDLTDQGVERMLGPIGLGLKKLKKLRFSLSHCLRVTNKSLEIIAKEVDKNLLDLKALQINLLYLGGGVNGQGFEVLNKELFQELKSLENLVFQASGFEDMNFESLLTGLKALKELKRVTLDFSDNKQVSEHSITNFLVQIKSEMVALEDLSVNLSDLSKDFSTLRFEENNTSHTNLKSFSLNLKSCKDLSVQEVENIYLHYIGHFPNLEQLQIEFDGTEAAETALLNKMREILSKLGQLKSLSLSFKYYNKISIEVAQKLILTISEVLPELATLKLTFNRHLYLQYLQNCLPEPAFAEQLEKLKCLKDYDINFV